MQDVLFDLWPDRSLEKIRRVVSAVGKPEGVRAERLAEIKQLFGKTVDEGVALKKRISLVE
jgi:hypothetical protein